MILIDSNIFMYSTGAPHEHKQDATDFLKKVANDDVDAAVDAEVFQEILHRYRAIGRWEDGRKVYDMTRRIVGVVIPIGIEIMDRARSLLDLYPDIMARDALHAAVCRHLGAEGICSYDRDFDRIRNIRRFEPGMFLK